jgi:hypothetical protein
MQELEKKTERNGGNSEVKNRTEVAVCRLPCGGDSLKTTCATATTKRRQLAGESKERIPRVEWYVPRRSHGERLASQGEGELEKGTCGRVSQEEPQRGIREMASRQGGSAAKGSSAVKLVGRNRIITRGGCVGETRHKFCWAHKLTK